MNCLALEQRGEVLLVDCGVTFDDRGLGIDVVHPDFEALETFGTRVAGVVITHGHEDHIGALPYLLQRHDVPVHGPPYALGLIRERLGEHEVLEHARLFETKPKRPFRIGSFEIEPIRVTHSIADATALAIRTDCGTVIHSGDFKVDDAPTDGEAFDAARLQELGDEGVTLLFSDSTNIDAPGRTGDEAGVGEALERVVREAKQAVVVGMFSSNVHRLRMLGDVARRTGRKIVLLGRGVGTHARVARNAGYLPWPSDLVWPDAKVRELPREKILAIATGSQGEERAALARIARDDHPTFRLEAGDTVVLSARTIPGNELEVVAVVDLLLRKGAIVKTPRSDRSLHVSGHAHRDEQRMMLELVRPRFFVPVHGTFHHLTRHAELGREVGVREAFVLENGKIADVTPEAIGPGGTAKTGRVHVWARREVPEAILRERGALAREGTASCVVVVDAEGRVLDCAVKTRGVCDDAGDHREAEAFVRRSLADLRERTLREGAHARPSTASMEEEARYAIRRAFHRSRGMKPVTVVHLVVRKGA